MELYKYEQYKGVETTTTDIIIQVNNQSYTKPKKDNILRFMNFRATDFIEHLVTKCIKLTQPKRNREIRSIEEPWNQEEEISTYFEYLDDKQEGLEKLKITWDDNIKITQAVQEIYNSEDFTEEELIDYKENPEVQKYWTSPMNYFISKHSRYKQYCKSRPISKGLESAAHM